MALQPKPEDPWNLYYQFLAENFSANVRFYYSFHGITAYVIDEWNSKTKNGHVAAINLVKVYSAYSIFWNSQMNYGEPAQDGDVFMTWFSPKWVLANENAYANFICTNTVTQG